MVKIKSIKKPIPIDIAPNGSITIIVINIDKHKKNSVIRERTDIAKDSNNSCLF